MGYKHNIEDVVAKGSELIRKRGYNNVGINDILKECEIPKGSFYNFFESKEHFAEKVLERYGRNAKSMISRWLNDKPGTPIERLRGFYQMLIDDNIRDGLNAGCLVTNLSYELAGTNDKLRKTVDEKFMGWVEVIAETVQAGQDAGEITKSMSALDLAEYLHTGFSGGFARMKAQKSPRYLENWLQMTFEFIKT